MIYKTLPDGGQIPVLGLGTWDIGGGMSPDYRQDDETVSVIEAAIEHGYTHIDTAEMYGGGHTEELVGRALRRFDRQSLFITTKVSPAHLRAPDVIAAFENSLKRLGTEYVDLYLIHWPNERIPLRDTFQGLNTLVRRGQVRHLGVSNFNVEQLDSARSLSSIGIVTNQVPYNLTNRRYARNGVLAACQENGLLLTAYSPLKYGALHHPTVREIAAAHSATPAQVALGWLVRQPQVITIPKSANRHHLKENLGALDLVLSRDDIDRLDRIDSH